MKISSIMILVIVLAGCAETGVEISDNGNARLADNAEKSSAHSIQERSSNKDRKEHSIAPEVARLGHIKHIGEIEKKALLGDKEASARLARSMSDDMELWTRIAIENGNGELAAQYVTYLMGKEPYNCYRALFFAEKAKGYSSEATREIDQMPFIYLSNLYKETSFQCGCPQEVPGHRYVCKNGKGAFEKI
jgi:hypothetical protein